MKKVLLWLALSVTVLPVLLAIGGCASWFGIREAADFVSDLPAVSPKGNTNSSGRSTPQRSDVGFWYLEDGRPQRFLATFPSDTYVGQSLSRPSGQSISFFVPYQIVKPHHVANQYLLANKLAVEMGWVPSSAGVLWPSRQGVGIRRYTVSEAKQNGTQPGEATIDFPIHFFADKDHLRASLEGDPEAPEILGIVENPKALRASFMKWPLLATDEVVVHGQRVRVFKVALVGMEDERTTIDTGYVRAKPAHNGHTVTAAGVQAIQDAVQVFYRLDIVFVMDMTNSMRPYHENFRDQINTIVSRLHKQYPNVDLQIGWAAYQDDLGGKEHYIGKYFGHFQLNQVQNDLKRLKTAIAKTELLDESSVDHPECVYWGTHLALTKFPWRDGSPRVLVVCGDAGNHAASSAKNKGGFSTSDMVEQFDRDEVVPFAIHQDNAHGKRLAGQIETIARAVRHKGGSSIPVNNADVDFMSSVSSLVLGKVSGVSQEADSVHRVKGATAREVAKAIHSLNEEEKSAIVRIIKSRPAGRLGAKFRTIIRMLEDDQPVDTEVEIGVHEAWVPETIGGIPIVETYELNSKIEVKRLQDYLRQIQGLKRSDSAELLKLGRFSQVFGDGSEMTQWLETDDATEPLSRYMQQEHHIVTRTPMFQMTKEDFRSMTQADRIELLRLAEKYDDYLQDVRIDDAFWRRIGEVDYVWLPSRELP